MTALLLGLVAVLLLVLCALLCSVLLYSGAMCGLLLYAALTTKRVTT